MPAASLTTSAEKYDQTPGECHESFVTGNRLIDSPAVNVLHCCREAAGVTVAPATQPTCNCCGVLSAQAPQADLILTAVSHARLQGLCRKLHAGTGGMSGGTTQGSIIGSRHSETDDQDTSM
jgi:hypothetical protein